MLIWIAVCMVCSSVRLVDFFLASLIVTCSLRPRNPAAAPTRRAPSRFRLHHLALPDVAGWPTSLAAAARVAWPCCSSCYLPSAPEAKNASSGRRVILTQVPGLRCINSLREIASKKISCPKRTRNLAPPVNTAIRQRLQKPAKTSGFEKGAACLPAGRLFS